MMNPFVSLAVVVVIVYAVLHQSGKKQEKQFWAKRATQSNPDAHAWVDNAPSSRAWAWCLVIAVIGGFIIVKTSGF